MDLKKTGEFIAKCRKEKGLTQEQLAKEVYVTEKAVSKWECGKSFPDVSNLPRLSSVLGVSINELLSGEKLTTPSNYIEQADKNLLETLKRSAISENCKLMLFIFCFIGEVLLLPNLIFILIELVTANSWESDIGLFVLFLIVSCALLVYIVYYLIDMHLKRKQNKKNNEQISNKI